VEDAQRKAALFGSRAMDSGWQSGKTVLQSRWSGDEGRLTGLRLVGWQGGIAGSGSPDPAGKLTGW
jgi:hypothetical protein